MTDREQALEMAEDAVSPLIMARFRPAAERIADAILLARALECERLSEEFTVHSRDTFTQRAVELRAQITQGPS